MLTEIQKKLVGEARRVQVYRKLDYNNYAGYVGVAVLAENGKIYTGIDIGVTCGIGFCAEHTAVAKMVMDGQSRALAMCAVGENAFFAPCGRCRELFSQINRNNRDMEVILGYDCVKKLSDLLPNQFWEYAEAPEAKL